MVSHTYVYTVLILYVPMTDEIRLLILIIYYRKSIEPQESKERRHGDGQGS